MGDITIVAYGVMAFAALVLSGIGAIRRIGFPGLAIGAVALGLLRRRRVEPS